MAMSDELAALARRVDELERRLEAAPAAEMAEGAGSVLRAPVRIIGPDGGTLAEFAIGQGAAGAPPLSLAFLGRDGTRLAAVGADTTGGFLCIRSPEGADIAVLDVESGGGRLVLSAAEGRAGLALFGYEEYAGINLMDPHGGMGATLFAHQDGGSMELFAPGAAKPDVAIGADAVGGRLEVRDQEGHPSRLPTREGDTP
jgi:hypothetical protein